MAFKSVLGVTGVDHSDQDVRKAAGLCAEVGAYLSVLVMSPPPLVMLASAARRWHPQVAWTMRTRHCRTGTTVQAKRFSQDTASWEKTSREIHKLVKATWRCYDVDIANCEASVTRCDSGRSATI
ncbi:hypothetical protein [Mesorhizobium sp. M0619]|uniref:hypothetical protein n=1 Tax=unclassified Mesorhizobium TaxID=325217 RepID=UPI0033372A6F